MLSAQSLVGLTQTAFLLCAVHARAAAIRSSMRVGHIAVAVRLLTSGLLTISCAACYRYLPNDLVALNRYMFSLESCILLSFRIYLWSSEKIHARSG